VGDLRGGSRRWLDGTYDPRGIGLYAFESATLEYSSSDGFAAAASNLHYPPQDRGFSPTVDRIALDLGSTALFDVAAEFWPNIRHVVHRAVGRH
jgi:hypothetical protein